jgi:hypothetical protein
VQFSRSAEAEAPGARGPLRLDRPAERRSLKTQQHETRRAANRGTRHPGPVDVLGTDRPRGAVMAPADGRSHLSWCFPRKEVIQPQLPLRLPCYDFTPVTGPTFGGCLP